MNTLAHTTLTTARLALAGLVLGGAALLGGAGEARSEVVNEFKELAASNTDTQQLRNNGDFAVAGQKPEYDYHIGFFTPVSGGISIIGYARNSQRDRHSLMGAYVSGSAEGDFAYGDKPYGALIVGDVNGNGIIGEITDGEFAVDNGDLFYFVDDSSAEVLLDGQPWDRSRLPAYTAGTEIAYLPAINIVPEASTLGLLAAAGLGLLRRRKAQRRLR